MNRHDLTDFEWSVIEPLLPQKFRGMLRGDDRRVLNGIFWRFRTRFALWADIPERYGSPTTCYNRFVRWSYAGIWDWLLGGLRRRCRDDRQLSCPGSSAWRCAQKKTAKPTDNNVMGRSRGGLTTKIHALAEAKGHAIRICLSLGQDHDSTKALLLLTDLGKGAILLADRVNDSDATRNLANDRCAWVNIPPKSYRKDSFAFSRWAYRQRNLVERFFKKLKQFRGIATRYDRKADNFLAAVKLVAVRLWLRIN